MAFRLKEINFFLWLQLSLGKWWHCRLYLCFYIHFVSLSLFSLKYLWCLLQMAHGFNEGQNQPVSTNYQKTRADTSGKTFSVNVRVKISTRHQETQYRNFLVVCGY